ncbi:MAG: transposase [Burkholderiales bacterium]|nr:transposase [Burkholderiales bacterium]
MEVTKSAHGVYSLKYHVVWVCKYRRRILNPALEVYLRRA